MKILNPKLNRKDPLNPLIGSKGNNYNFQFFSKNNHSYDLGSSNQNSSFLKNTFNNYTNRISSNRQISILSDIFTENKRISYTNNKLTVSSDNLFAYLNNNNNNHEPKKTLNVRRKKKVRFLNDENFAKIILVESHKKFHQLDDIYDNNQKDIDKIKDLKNEIKNKKLYENTKRNNISPIKFKEGKGKENKKETNKNEIKNSKNYNDKACKCLIF
jgi:hypothetical protein